MAAATSASTRFIVLAAVDDSESVHEILRAGARFAREAPNGELHLIHVVEAMPPVVSLVPPPTGMGISRREIVAAARAYVEALAVEAREQSRGSVTTRLAVGNARAEILKAAGELRADIVLVGTHGRRGVQRMLLGSVAEGVVRGAECPVLVVRAKDYQPAPPAAVDAPETRSAP